MRSFGSRDPATQRVVQTTYTAGNRGFRARGPNIARQMDLSQSKIPYQPPFPPNSPSYQPTYDGYRDPNEDPSYKFSLKTPTYSRVEAADSKGMVDGAFSYTDDVGKRHDVKYEAGSKTGFHVKTAFPDSEPYTGLFYRGPNKPGTPPRGHLSIVQGTDGAYQFTATGPDQKRIEVSDSIGRVRGSYTYIDDKGVQRTVQYVAGPNIGYKVIRKGSGPVYSTVYPFPITNFLVPPLPPESSLPESSTSSTPETTNDLFEPQSHNLGINVPALDDNRPLDDTNDFLNPTKKPSTSTTTYHISTERTNHWNSPHTTLKPPKPHSSDFFKGLNANRPSENPQSSVMSFNDIFGDDSNSYDNSKNEFKPHSNLEESYNSKKLSNNYSYPKPNKSFNEEPDQRFLGQNGNHYPEINRNILGLPPGVVVRAHVQSLDILPYGSRVPPPEETLRKHLFEDLRGYR